MGHTGCPYVRECPISKKQFGKGQGDCPHGGCRGCRKKYRRDTTDMPFCKAPATKQKNGSYNSPFLTHLGTRQRQQSSRRVRCRDAASTGHDNVSGSKRAEGLCCSPGGQRRQRPQHIRSCVGGLEACVRLGCHAVFVHAPGGRVPDVHLRGAAVRPQQRAARRRVRGHTDGGAFFSFFLF